MSDTDATAQHVLRALVRDRIAPGLRALGFSGGGTRYELPSDTHWLLLGVQKSKHARADRVPFTVNLAAVRREDWEAMRVAGPTLGARPAAVQHPGADHERLGTLMGFEDRWWSVRPADAPDVLEAVATEILTAVESVGIPWLRACERRPSRDALAGQIADARTVHLPRFLRGMLRRRGES